MILDSFLTLLVLFTSVQLILTMSGFIDLVLNTPEPQAPPRPTPHPPIRRTKALKLTRDQRRDCQLFHSIGWSYSQIHKHTGATYTQVAKACQPGAHATPKKGTSRPPILS